ncbi:MAG: UDP-2,3-diacylglucosamine diphosphatase [Balneolaceae bacterium]|nr:UDP-2,3-diacylglucosamine diphosphatase [Balneolaceae bacterium]
MATTPEGSEGILFLSDAHLGGFDETRNRRIEASLIRLIDYCEARRYRICVLGDLFDYWMEYADRGWAPDLGGELLERFRAFNDPARPTLYITGNHDCWTGPRLPACGFDVEHRWREQVLGGKKVLLMHGDGLPDPEHPERMERPPLHRLLRNKNFVKGYQKILPPGTGTRLMRLFSRLTRSFEGAKHETRVLDGWAERFLQATDFDLVICGHDHNPRMRAFDFGTFLNLGTFYRHRSLCLYNKEDFSLVVWNNADGELRPYRPNIDE